MNFFTSHLPTYYKWHHVLWHYIIRIFSVLVLLFLMLPILTIIPLSFNVEPFFTFTAKMLSFDPEGYSLRWYEEFFLSERWNLAVKNSFIYGFFATIISMVLGTIAAMGLSSEHMPYKNIIMALLISPMIVPLIIMAAGMYFFYSTLGLIATDVGVIISHAVLGIPFVVITVTASLAGFDRNLINASVSLGAGHVRTFLQVVFPIIKPGVISGGLFALAASFDEVIIILFVGGPLQRTIPKEMFSGLREQISPTILAAASLLIIVSIIMLRVIESLRQKSLRVRGVEE